MLVVSYKCDRQMVVADQSVFGSKTLLLAAVLCFTVASALDMPRIIYGTAWKKDETQRLVVEALQLGFRAIDVACQPKHYDEPGVGRALEQLFNEQVFTLSLSPFFPLLLTPL